jgi:copper chaperone CopZ
MKKAGGWFLAVAGAAALLASCRTRDIRTVRIALPDMKDERCAAIVDRTLRGVDGIDVGSIKFESKSVTVTYDSMKTAIKNIEHAVADAGFTANEMPAKEAARAALPPECR